MSTKKQMQGSGEVGVALISRHDRLSDAEQDAFDPEDRFLVLDPKGFMYVIAQRDLPDEDIIELSLRQCVEDNRDMHGPLVSRRRIDMNQRIAHAMAERAGKRIVTDDGDGMETWSIDPTWLAEYASRDEYTEDEKAVLKERPLLKSEAILDEVYVMVLPLGIERDALTRSVTLGDSQAASRKRLSADGVLEEVWIEDSWIPTIEDITGVATRGGYNVSEAAVGKALQRGPYEKVTEAKRGQPATWKRKSVGGG